MLSIPLINHLLSHNPDVCAQLAGYNGIVIALQTGSLNIIARINAQGLLEASTQRPDSTLILHNNALSNILRGAMPQFSDLAIEGDTTIGINLLSWCSQLRSKTCNASSAQTKPTRWRKKPSKSGKPCKTSGNFSVLTPLKLSVFRLPQTAPAAKSNTTNSPASWTTANSSLATCNAK